MIDIAGELRNMNWRNKSLPDIRNMLSPRCLPVGDMYKSLTNHRASAFLQLTQISWFERVWVIQEVAMAQRATVIYGRRSISSSVFSMIPSLLGIELSAHAQATLELMPGWLKLQSPSSQDRRLLTLLRRFKDSKSSLEHDRVYALIGLASDVSDFPVYYSISFQEVISNTAWYLATGSPRGYIIFPEKLFSYSEMLEECANEKDIVKFIFSRALKSQQGYNLLQLLHITSRVAESSDLLEDYIVNLYRLRTIIEDHFPGLVEQEESLVQDTLSALIKPQIIRQTRGVLQDTDESMDLGGFLYGKSSTETKNWIRRMLLRVTVHGDVSTIKLMQKETIISPQAD